MPTMWKSVRIKDEIKKLQESSFVKEIIVINNNVSETSIDLMQFSKVIEIRVPQNIFVNPAWNTAYKLCTAENICIHSDDITLESYDCLHHVEEKLKNEDCMIGVFDNCYKLQIEFQPEFKLMGDRTWGWGCLMFMRRNSYKHIPESLKIWHGDNILIQRFKRHGKSVYSMDGVKITTEMSTTSDLPQFEFKFGEEDIYKSLVLAGEYCND